MNKYLLLVELKHLISKLYGIIFSQYGSLYEDSDRGSTISVRREPYNSRSDAFDSKFSNKS